MQKQSVSWTHELLQKEISKLNISQVALSNALEASQSQVSRVLSGQTSMSSKLARGMQEYVFMRLHGSGRSRVTSNEDLMEALEVAWDGTPSHARALAAVIRSLALLQRSSPTGSNH